ncbi:MAG: ribosomal-processing cysteine protease Prp [Bacilli bacterium]|nr:ribosomal-processing cysteine protease Prp [Bacilli bacterium]
MTKASFILNNSKPYAFTISGHAEYGNYGEDIVCSSITTAVFTTLNLLDKLLNEEDYTLIQNEDKGLIDFKLNKTSKLSLLIIQNLLDILINIEEQYPQNLKIIIK